jgi:hypothetical protein
LFFGIFSLGPGILAFGLWENGRRGDFSPRLFLFFQKFGKLILRVG